MPKYKAAIELLEIGGRRTPTVAGYRPHLVLYDQADYLGIKFCDPMNFGINEVSFECLYEHIDYSAIEVGSHFTIREGSGIVGIGKIVGIIS
jgi:translation elongation factor EF-Tu-like GTPase